MSQDTPSGGDSFAPSPATFPVLPRAVRLRAFPWFGGGALLFLGAICICLCPATIVPLAFTTLGKWAGTEAPGKITKKEDRGRRGHSYVLQFQFHLHGKAHDSEVFVDLRTYNELKVDDPNTVRALSFRPALSAAIVEPKIGIAGGYFAAAGVTLITGAVFVLLTWLFVSQAVRRRKVAKFGTATLGKITGKHVLGLKVHRYRLTYSYIVAAGAQREASMDVSEAQFKSISSNQTVTVLYDPAHPELSVIYCFGEYGVVGV